MKNWKTGKGHEKEMQVTFKHINRCSKSSLMKNVIKLLWDATLPYHIGKNWEVWENTPLVRWWEKRHLHTLLIGIYISAITMSKNLAITIKIKETSNTIIQHMIFFRYTCTSEKLYRCTHLFIAAYCLTEGVYIYNIKIYNSRRKSK